MKADNPEEAIEEFLGVPALEPEKGEWWASCPDTNVQTTHAAIGASKA